MGKQREKYHLQSRHIYNAWDGLGKPQLRTILECATGNWSLLQRFEGLCGRCILIEPSPKMAAQARSRYPWAQVIEVAITDSFGRVNLRRLAGQSYVKGIPWAPAFKKNTKRLRRAGKTTVGSCPFDAVDDGEIDLLNLDCEGSEWFVLKNMKSRPLLIQVELEGKNGYYSEICDWFDVNGYVENKALRWGCANRIYERR